MASNRIELVYPKENYKSFVPNGAGIMDNEEYDLLMNFSQGNVQGEQVRLILKKYKISFLLVSSNKAADELKNIGYNCISIEVKNNIFLLYKS